MRNRFGQPREGICLNCGTIVRKVLRIPLRSMRCSKCRRYAIVRRI